MIKRRKTVLFVATALGTTVATPAFAQETTGNEIIVTAQRIEQRLQDVPISITVYDQKQLSNQNINSAKDLGVITPGLAVNSRFGSDSTNFSIRGFTQEQRTSATVGVYFADVVAPRGSGGTFGGDGAGPGSLFDLQNIQVLKGPQGTLQGRNSTGGAVLLVPNRPTDRFEGYVEGSLGDYKMRRVQSVLNIPLAETFKVRLGLDRQTRNGYLNNIGNLGDGLHGDHGMGDVDYWAGRISILAELTPDLENYTVANYTHSDSNGVIPRLIDCSDSVSSQNFGVLTRARCEAQLARQSSSGFFTVQNRLADSASELRQWQIINTTKWTVSDNLTVTNIASYGEFRQRTNIDLFGNYYLANASVNPASVTSGGQVTGFAFTHANPFNGRTNAQSTFVEELRLSGNAGDALTWQAGAYMERNDPLGFSGVQTATGTACADIDALNCVSQPGFSLGTINSPISMSLSKTKFTDYALYGQASYKITPEITFTAGLRYTWDKQRAVINVQGVNPLTATCLNQLAPDFGVPHPAATRLAFCNQNLQQTSKAPTWTVGVDYKPIEDIMLYAKWSRGYRAGGLSLFGPDSAPRSAANPNPINLQPYDQEKVDNYEVGAKTGWSGPVPGNFNISAFYDKFSDQQLLLGAVIGVRPNALVANAGKSRLYGLEADVNLRPFDGMVLSASYAYLSTKIQAFTAPDVGPGVTLTPPLVGDPIPNTQPHKLNLSANYRLPLSESVGRISFGATWVYTASYEAVVPSCPAADASRGCYDASNNQPFLTAAGTPTTVNTGRINPGSGLNNANSDSGRIPSSRVLNLNATWEKIAGSSIDAAFFMTNVTNEKYFVSLNDNTSRSFRSGLVGEPRMYGFRLRYAFGQ
jgi:iron complex outermembrane receptor protein